MSKLHDIWRVIVGQLSYEDLLTQARTINNLNRRCVDYEQTIFTLERDLEFAKVGIADLKNQLQYGGEAQREAESDKITVRLITEMHDNPKKFVP